MAIPLPPEAVASLRALTTGLGADGADLVLVGDGSGQTYDRPAGWAVAAFEPAAAEAHVLTGSLSNGTNNLAELMPYLEAFWFYDQRRRQRGDAPGGDVRVVSDSELTVRCGNREYGRNANRWLWGALDELEQAGYRCRWSHVPRNSNPWSAWMDEVAGFARLAAEEFERATATMAWSRRPWPPGVTIG